MHRDTPIEILHVIRLGPTKYLLYFTIQHIKNSPNGEKDLDELKQRMKMVNMDNLPRTLSIKSMVKWMGSMAGRDAGLFAQIAPFVLDGLVSEDLLDAWTILSRFHLHSYEREIANPEEYAREMRILHLQLVSALGKVDPGRLQKPKLHILVHLAAQALTMGPPILLAAEVFESYNKIIRGIMFLTNRLSPSRDVGIHFVFWRTMRHICALGFYLAFDRASGSYVWKRPGESNISAFK